MKKLIFAVVAGVVIVLGVFSFFKENPDKQGKKGGKARGKKAAVAVEVKKIIKDKLIDQGLFSGTLLASSKFSVVPRISGRIRKLMVDIGDKISNGQIVAELDDEELVLASKQAEAELEIVKANYNETAGLLEIAKKELQRTETMRKQKVSSDVDLEKAQAAFKTSLAKHQVSKAQLSNKQAALDTTKVKLSYAKVDVSWSGGSNQRFVSERFLDEGATTGPNNPILTVIDIATLTAVLDVVEKEYFKIKVGQTAVVEAAAIPDCLFSAKVTRIAPSLDSTSRLARVELEISNSEFDLKPGMFVTAKIIFEVHNSVTIVPASSIVRRQNKNGIFVVNPANMTASFVPVKMGFSDAENVEIASPTISGEVVTLGHHLLEDGAALKVANLEENSTNGQHNSGKAGK